MHADVRTYLAALPPSARRVLKQLRSEILAVAPDSVEAFSYRIPAFKLDGRAFIWYAGFTEHVSLYSIGDAIRTANARALEGLGTSKGTVRFPLSAPLPLTVVRKLVRKLVRARVREVRGLALLLVTLVGLACARSGAEAPPEFEVTARFPHDTTAYTQGLVWDDSVLYESTGRYSHSELRRVELRTGRVLASHALPASRYGEGLARVGGRLYQLTWRSGVCYVYDAATLAPLDSFTYAGEGWGLATDGAALFMSDGSDSVRVLSPATFTAERVIHVRYKGAPVLKLNELEYVDGALLANVYETDLVVWIDPTSGAVTRVLDFGALYPDRPLGADVLNGIAIAPASGQLLLTGKYWPVLFQVRLAPPMRDSP